MQYPAEINHITTTDTIQYLKIKYKSDKKLRGGQAVLFNEKMFIVIEITSIGLAGIKAITTASLSNIRKLIQQPYFIKQD
jgi:hypothetical protein